MCPNHSSKLAVSLLLRRRSRPSKGMSGFLLPAALFLLVVMGLFSSALVTISTQTGMATVQEGVSLSALNAADSGAQLVMSTLFYPEDSRTVTDTRCVNISAISPITYNVTGLQGCQASLSCTVATDAANTTSFYSITSVGSCGSGQAQAQRTIQASAILE